MRRQSLGGYQGDLLCFNLRREAAPHATCLVWSALVVSRSVSISDEKPLHMRRHASQIQSVAKERFQSQTRSRSTCDMIGMSRLCHVIAVSISDEKPLHMRRNKRRSRMVESQLVSISDEKPLHMRQLLAARGIVHCAGFNLRREAAPHATIEPILEATELSPVSISDEKPLHMRPKEDPSA